MTLLNEIMGRLRNGEPALSFPDLPTQPATVENPTMTLDQFQRATGVSLAMATRWHPFVEAAMRNFHIDTPLVQAHFLAQVCHESNGFSSIVESLNYSVAGLRATFPTRITQTHAEMYGRKDGQPANQKEIAKLAYNGRLGNRQNSDDGWLFRGRGLIQITGRSNYKDCGEGIGIDLENQPARLEEDKYAALSAAWYWDSRKVSGKAENDDLTGVTRLINGGTIGLEDRRARLDRAKAVLCG